MNIMLIDTNSSEMKYAFNYIEGVPGINSKSCFYWPITIDAQAMALAKRFCLQVNYFAGAVKFPFENPLSNLIYNNTMIIK